LELPINIGHNTQRLQSPISHPTTGPNKYLPPWHPRLFPGNIRQRPQPPRHATNTQGTPVINGGPSGIITSPLLYLHTIHVPPSWCYRFTPGTRICTPTPRPAPGTLARCKPFTQGLTSPRCNPLYTSGPTLQRLLQRALFTPGERYNTRPPPTLVTAPGVNLYTEADGHVTRTGAASRAAPPLSRSLEPLSRHRRQVEEGHARCT